jgi:hypothetical protein
MKQMKTSGIKTKKRKPQYLNKGGAVKTEKKSAKYL